MTRRPLLFVAAIAALLGAAPLARAANAEPFARREMSEQDLSAYAEARIAALKAGLQLKAEQEKNWPALETALRDAAKARVARKMARGEDDFADFESDPVGALQRRAQNMAARAGELDKIAAAAKPLYDSLDEAQKRRFGDLLMAALHGRMGGMGGMGWRHGGHGHGHGHGMRHDRRGD